MKNGRQIEPKMRLHKKLIRNILVWCGHLALALFEQQRGKMCTSSLDWCRGKRRSVNTHRNWLSEQRPIAHIAQLWLFVGCLFWCRCDECWQRPIRIRCTYRVLAENNFDICKTSFSHIFGAEHWNWFLQMVVSAHAESHSIGHVNPVKTENNSAAIRLDLASTPCSIYHTVVTNSLSVKKLENEMLFHFTFFCFTFPDVTAESIFLSFSLSPRFQLPLFSVTLRYASKLF